MSKSTLTSAQTTALQKAMAELSIALPNLNPKEIFTGPLAEYVHGPLPTYSNLKTHKVTNVATAMVGSFVICFGFDAEIGEPLVLVIKRGDKGPNGEERFGVTGGYTNLDFTEGSLHIPASLNGEQPAEGAVRELSEELLDDKGQPILTIDPQRLRVIKTGVDYRAVAKGGLPTQYNGHVVELTPVELENVKQHVTKLQTDPAYRDAVETASKGEVSNVLLMRFAEVMDMLPSQFTHPHELSAIKELKTILEPSVGKPVYSTLRPLTPTFP